MIGRVLLVTFQQALRSIVLSLLPITTISLIGWSLAGSQTGNTSDPLRASIWFWLGSHLIPFELKLAPAFISTLFNYLPIAAAFIPAIAIRSGFKRASLELENERASRSFITLWYGLFVTIAAIAMQSETVKPVIYLAPIYAGAIALISTINFRSKFFNPFRYLGYLFITLLGLAIIGITYSLAINFPVIKSLTAVVEPGWVGGVLLVVLQILYLPNLAAAAISYICGLGFSIGKGTLVSPFIFKLNGIPAIPILGALPIKASAINLVLITIPVAFLLLNQIRNIRSVKGVGNGLRKIIESTWIFLPILIIFGYQSGGTFISNSLNPFGIKWWTLASIFLSLQIAMTVLFYLTPAGIKKLVNR